jgi:hypothetical protein
MLSDAEIAQYLINVILIMRADGTVAPREESTLETIRQESGAKKADLNRALKSVEAGSASLIKTGRFSDQIRNLEDMLFIRLIDNNLSEAASNLISQFCGQIGVSQDQLNLMVQQGCDRSHNNGEITCASCGQTAPAEAKFCPHCGAPFTQSSPVPVEMAIPKTGWAIEFCESTSSNFSQALTLAQSAPTFSTCVKAKKNWYLAGWPEDQFESCTNLALILGPIRNRKLYQDGKELIWDEVFGFSWCANQRAQSYQPAEYCFGRGDNRINLWGCKQARLDWAEWGEWYTFGKFKKSATFGGQVTWVFDKDRIRHDIMTNIQRFRYCPHLRMNLIDAVINALPEEVLITKTSPWKYKTNYEEVPGSIKVVEHELDDGVDYKRVYFANGVVPKGLEAAKGILQIAFETAAVSDVTVKAVLGQ